MIARGFLLIFAIVAGALASPARAQVDTNPCKTELRGQMPPGSVVATIFEKFAGYPAVQVCAHGAADAPHLEYFLLSEIKRSEAGFCRFSSVQLLLDQDTNAPTKVPLFGDLYLLQTPGPCPKWDDEGYLPTRGVSEGVSVEAMKLWQSLQGDGIRTVLSPYKDKSDRYIDGLLKKAARGGTKLATIRFMDPWDVPFAEGGGWNHYAMMICTPIGVYILVVFDVSPTGLQIIDVVSMAN